MNILAKLFTNHKMLDRLWELERENLRLKAEAKYNALLLEDYKTAYNRMLKLQDLHEDML